jgi:hypothetical protein
MNINDLQTELAKAQYENLSDADILALLNTVSADYTVKVPGSVVYEAILGTGAIAILKHLEAQITSTDAQTQQMAGAASAALAVINSPVERDFALPAGQIHDALDALQLSGLFPAGFNEFVRNLSRRTPASVVIGAEATQAHLNIMRLSSKAGQLNTLISELNGALGSLQMGTDVDLSAYGID